MTDVPPPVAILPSFPSRVKETPVKKPVAIGMLLGLAMGCATTSPQPGRVLSFAGNPPVEAAPPQEFKPRSYRIGIGDLDLFALDYEERGTTFRLFDLKVFRLLEVGSGPEYKAFGLMEVPGLLNVASSRQEEDTGEIRFFDVQALELALVRQQQDSATEGQTHFMKFPGVGSLVSLQTDESEPTLEHHNYFFVLRRDVERTPLEVPQVAAPGP